MDTRTWVLQSWEGRKVYMSWVAFSRENSPINVSCSFFYRVRNQVRGIGDFESKEVK
jgi:hypothetical protein